MKKILVPVFAALLLMSCGTTASIESSWREPDVKIDMSKLNKVLVVALLKNEIYRRAAESQLVGLLKGKAVASYSYFDKEDYFQPDEILKQQLKKDGFEGVIFLRLADVEKDVSFVTGATPAYGRFGPYWSASWNAYYNPGHYETTKKFTVQTNVYSLKIDKLVWSSLTSSVDPANADKLMKAVGKEVYKKMKKDGFIVNQ